MKTRILITLAIVAILLPSCSNNDISIVPPDTEDTSVKYYISSSEGNDSNTGLSENSPWKSLDKVSSQVFEPGVSILFKRGDEWDGTVRFYGSGEEDSPINVGSYGKGNKPILHGEGVMPNRRLYIKAYSSISGTLEILEGSHWHVDGLEITNYKSGPAEQRVGILVVDTCKTADMYKKNPQYGITITNCYIHDVVSSDAEKRTGGILLMGNISDVLIDGNRIKDVSVSGIRNLNWASQVPGYENYMLQNYKVSNNVLENIVGDCIVYGGVENGVMEYNYINGYCIGDPKKNYAALWTWACKDIIIQRNEITGGGSTVNDGAPFDVDYYNTNIVIQYNYTHNNKKGICLFPKNSTGTVFRHNISINDAQLKNARLFPYSIPDAKQAPFMYNNIIYQSASLSSLGIFNNSVGVNRLYMKFYNNIIIGPNTLRPSVQNTLAYGKIDGNIFGPNTLINKWSKMIEPAIYGQNNTLLDRTDLAIPNIDVSTEPNGLITGHNTFNTSKLTFFNGLNKIFTTSSLPNIKNRVDAEALEDLGGVSPAVVDFFGNPVY